MRAFAPATQQVGAALRSTVVATVVEDGAILLDLESKYFYRLNEPAWAITQLFETSGVTAQDVLECCARWGAQAQDESAIRSFLTDLSREDLLEESSASVPALVEFAGPWSLPSMQRQAEPLQTLVTSAFDPSIPLAE